MKNVGCAFARYSLSLIRIMLILTVTFLLGMICSEYDAHAATAGEEVAARRAAVFRAIDYKTNNNILNMLMPNFKAIDILNRKTEIASRDGRNINSITDAEAKKELAGEYIVVSFGQSFDNVLQNIEPIIAGLVDNHLSANTWITPDDLLSISENAEKVLVGLVYLDRMYNFNMGGTNIRDVIMYTPDVYSKTMTIDQFDLLIRIADAGGNNLKVSNGTSLFGSGKVFTNSITNASTLAEFLEENRQKFVPGKTMDEWFKDASRAYIVDKGPTGLYTRFWADTLLRTHILPLLNVSDNSIYVIANQTSITYGIVDCYVDRGLKDSNPSLYNEKIVQFRRMVDSAANQQDEFIKLWGRICKSDVKSQLSSNWLVKDSLRIYSDDPYAYPGNLWSPKYGDNMSQGVREFIVPLDMYVNYTHADGEADGGGVRYYISMALTENGLTTYSHELTHIWASNIILAKNGIRDGCGAEIYTRGTFETYSSNDPPAFNLNFIYNRSGVERFHNALPSRFQSAKDLQSYMQGIMDVIYTLDYAEAKSILARSTSDKQKWFHKISQIDDSSTRTNQGGAGYTHKLDKVEEITQAEAGQLTSLDALVDNSMIASRYEVNGTTTTGTVASNGYYVVPLFSANYAGVQNDSGVSGDLMIHRQAFELLAEYGYYEGMVPYISNQYKSAAVNAGEILSDTFILNRIFNGKYSSMADFKKAMFRKRINKVDNLAPVTITWEGKTVKLDNFEALSELMDKAVDSDIKTSATVYGIRSFNTQVEMLKAEVFKAYLNDTNDFSGSIYTNEQKTPADQKLPNTSAEDNSIPYIAIFVFFAALTLGLYMLKNNAAE